MKSRNNLKKKLTLIDKLKSNSEPLQNLGKKGLENLRGYEAIGLKSHFSQKIEPGKLRRTLNPRVSREEKITEQITFYLNTNKEEQETEQGIFPYNQTITACLTYNRKTLISPLYKIKTLHKFLSTYPSNKIVDTKHDAGFFQHEIKRGKIDLNKLKKEKFIHYLTKENLEETKKYL